MIIAIPQLSYIAGNVEENSKKIISAIRRAQQSHAELVIFPQLAICGTLPQDLLEREDFIHSCRMAIETIASHCTHIAAIIGGPNLDATSGIMYNSAYFIQNGEVVDGVHKNILSDYDIFNESRFFIAGEDNTPLLYKNQHIRIIFDEYESEFIDRKDSLVIYMGLNPFTLESTANQKHILSDLAQKYGKSMIAINHCSSCTSVLFDGNSMVFNYKGKPVLALQQFAEDFHIIDTEKIGSLPALSIASPGRIALMHRALIFGIREYFRNHGFSKAILGLSGGIDSALVAALAVEALGATNVMGLLMPSQYSTAHSVTDAEALARHMGICYETIPIKNIYEQYLSALEPLFDGQPFNVAEENIQARIRGMLVMAMSNKYGHIPLNTSNKSEAAVGYGTLYGDLCGSLGVIGDVYKTDVYHLARYINREREIIPEHTITKAPSAELRPGQKDQDSLPEYEQLDAILRLYLEGNLSPEAIIAKGYKDNIVNRIIQMVNRNEYKRAQCPPSIKISTKAFGNGRKYPY